MGFVSNFDSDENEKTFFVDFTEADPLKLDKDNVEEIEITSEEEIKLDEHNDDSENKG